MSYPNAVRSLKASRKALRKKLEKIEPEYFHLREEVRKLDQVIATLEEDHIIIDSNYSKKANLIMQRLLNMYPEQVAFKELAVACSSVSVAQTILSKLREDGIVNSLHHGFWGMTKNGYEKFGKENKKSTKR
jgi:DNA repair exonuclease SbcCD ATPase subunit